MNDERLTPLLQAYRQAPEPELMEQLVEGYLPLARQIARRFSGRGVELEDLEQVASIGLMKAIQRFKPELGLRFATYATPTIAGDVRNYIRDKGESLRLPRDSKNKLYHLQKAREKLTLALMREPTMVELAQETHMSLEDLLALLEMRKSADVFFLDAPMDPEEEQRIIARLGTEDTGFEAVEHKDWINWVYQRVTPDEKKLLELRYEHRLGQRETAKRMGVSQMQVSRMERRVLNRLKNMEQSVQ
jgi:RNA polymerase sigma-B factor